MGGWQLDPQHTQVELVEGELVEQETAGVSG
jgi:hypothetical protein